MKIQLCLLNIRDNNIRGVGAIASLEASKIYTLQILETSIQTIKNNKTRFVILEKNKKILLTMIRLLLNLFLIIKEEAWQQY